MATARDLINGSLRLLGVVASGESATASEHVDSLEALNAMLDSWASESRCVYIDTRESFSLIPGKSSYTFGLLGDFPTARPIEVMSAHVLDSSTGVRTPLELLNTTAWDNLQVKTFSGDLPLKLYADNAHPLMSINLWPVPKSTRTLEITTRKQIISIPTVNTVIDLPPGYARALRYNLAIELAPEFGKSATPEIAAIAEESKMNVKRTNSEDIYMTVDDAAMAGRKARFNILADD